MGESRAKQTAVYDTEGRKVYTVEQSKLSKKQCMPNVQYVSLYELRQYESSVGCILSPASLCPFLCLEEKCLVVRQAASTHRFL
jgi:hypothetical protein